MKGAKNILSTAKKLRLLLCAYHRQNDADDLREILVKNNFSVEYSKGYMIFTLDKDLAAPYLRKGLIRARSNGGKQ